MGRWEPDAAGRLAAAAMALFVEQGYDQVTVAEIADRAGVTARTFFRHFGDKREVLFSGSARLLTSMVDALAGAPPTASPLEAVGAALEAAAHWLGSDREWTRRRQALIATHADLRERELMKLSALSVALAEALRARGVAEPGATLAAEAGTTVFRVAFDLWIADGERRTLAAVMHDSLEQLRAVTR